MSISVLVFKNNLFSALRWQAKILILFWKKGYIKRADAGNPSIPMNSQYHNLQWYIYVCAYAHLMEKLDFLEVFSTEMHCSADTDMICEYFIDVTILCILHRMALLFKTQTIWLPPLLPSHPWSLIWCIYTKPNAHGMEKLLTMSNTKRKKIVSKKYKMTWVSYLLRSAQGMSLRPCYSHF